MDEITILIVDDNDAKAQNISKLLQFEKDIKILEVARTGQEGIARYHALKPDVILMDTNLPDKDGFLVTAEIVAADPSAQIIFSALDPLTDLTEKAMDAGAAGFIVRPIDDAAKMIEKIRRAAERGRKLRASTAPPARPPEIKPRGKIIAVYGVRGGAGCTTIATNLALLLQTDDTPAVVLDADRQFGDVAAFMDAKPRYMLDDLVSHSESLDPEMVREMLAIHESGVAILAGPASPEAGEGMTDAGLSNVLDALEGLFAYIVADVPSVLDDLSLTILGRADAVLVVLTPDIPATKNARLFLETLERLAISPHAPILVLNQADKRVGLRADGIAKALKLPIAIEIPYEREVVMTSINKGKPLVVSHKTNPLTRSLQALAGQVRERLLTENVKP